MIEKNESGVKILHICRYIIGVYNSGRIDGGAQNECKQWGISEQMPLPANI